MLFQESFAYRLGPVLLTPVALDSTAPDEVTVTLDPPVALHSDMAPPTTHQTTPVCTVRGFITYPTLSASNS